MKLDNRLILKLFALFTDLPDTELEKWISLCDGAGSKLSGLIKPGTDIKRHMERLCGAAAACAYCDYIMISGSGSRSANELRVGDISIKNSRDSNAQLDAASTREHFLTGVSDLIEIPSGFAFTLSECKL